MGRKPIDETGNIYGRLTVLRMATEEEYPRGAGKPIRWLCQCECGNTTFADGRDLRNGSRVSCGCQSREKAKILAYNLGKQNGANLTGQRFGHLLVIEKAVGRKTLTNLIICGSVAVTVVQQLTYAVVIYQLDILLLVGVVVLFTVWEALKENNI